MHVEIDQILLVGADLYREVVGFVPIAHVHGVDLLHEGRRERLGVPVKTWSGQRITTTRGVGGASQDGHVPHLADGHVPHLADDHVCLWVYGSRRWMHALTVKSTLDHWPKPIKSFAAPRLSSVRICLLVDASSYLK